MDIFDSPYYKINRILHQSLGCWPYQHHTKKYILRISFVTLNISMLIPEIMKLIYVRNDLNLAMDCLPIFITHIISIAKFFTYIINDDKIMDLFNTIRYDWLHVTSREEQNIMHEYAETGKKISVLNAIGYYSCMVIYLIVTFTPRVLDIILPLNESRPYIFISGTEYTIDPIQYYTPIITQQSIATLSVITAIAATDSTYSVYAHHGCGMFAIVKHQLNNMRFDEESTNRLSSNDIENCKRIVNCIEQHKRAIWFCDLLESSHVGLMFVILLTSVLGLSITGLQAVSNPDSPLRTLQASTLCLGHFMHILYYSWNSQKILDHSSTIFDAAYNAEWYGLLDKTRKLLTFMMLRSTKPCTQTAGTMFPMTLMNFTVIVKTSMSYFTVLTNFQ